MYLTIKSIHMTVIVVSISIFLCRGIMMLMGNVYYRHKLFRRITPVIDSLLLVTGVSLMIYTNQYPTTQTWLGVKLVALVIYIALGIIALNRVNYYPIQSISFVSALLTVLFMVSVAITHNPLGFFILFPN